MPETDTTSSAQSALDVLTDEYIDIRLAIRRRIVQERSLRGSIDEEMFIAFASQHEPDALKRLREIEVLLNIHHH